MNLKTSLRSHKMRSMPPDMMPFLKDATSSQHIMSKSRARCVLLVAVVILCSCIINLIPLNSLYEKTFTAYNCCNKEKHRKTLHARPHGSTIGKSEELKTFSEEDLIKVAMDIFLKRGLVLFTIINDAYVDFAASWLCNTAPLLNVHSHVLFVTTDPETGQRLRRLDDEISVVSLNASKYSGDQLYSHVGYVRIMIERTRIIRRLLESGVRVLLFEVDCVWLSDPIPLLLSRRSDADIVATRVHNRTAGGFLLLNPTERTQRLWRRLTAEMDELFIDIQNEEDSTRISQKLNDQQYLAVLIKKRFVGVEVVHLPVESFADGQWYRQPAEVRNAKPPPIIINNNFIRSNAGKKKRAAKFGHWFLNKGRSTTEGPQDLCNTSAVDSVIFS